MKRYVVIIVAILMALMAIEIVMQDRKISVLTEERDKYKSNTETLLADCETFKVRDSLNAAKVGTLELTIKEFETYRAVDAQLMKEMAGKNRELEQLNKAQAQTIIELRAAPKDTVLIVDSIPIQAKKVQCGDEWYRFTGLMTDESFTGTLENKESLILTETVKYKRILWWKTKKVKDRELEATSLNPHTTITGLEHIIIDK